MSIEIRELIVRAQVGSAAPAAPATAVPPPAWVERLRREMLAEMRRLLAEQQQQARER